MYYIHLVKFRLLIKSTPITLASHAIYRIMVLDAGRVKEFAAPNELLSDKKSSFYSMAKDAGLTA